MSILFSDTSSEAERILVDLLRKTPGWQKLRMVGQLNQTVRTLALCGLKRQFPDATPEELKGHLADLLLGKEIATQIYGFITSKEDCMLSEPFAVTLLVIDALDSLDVPYLIGGSLASALYGVVRTTIDADLVADLPFSHVIALAEALNKEFYVSVDAIQDAIKHKGSFNIIHLNTCLRLTYSS